MRTLLTEENFDKILKALEDLKIHPIRIPMTSVTSITFIVCNLMFLPSHTILMSHIHVPIYELCVYSLVCSMPS